MNNNAKEIYCTSCCKHINLSPSDMNKIGKLDSPKANCFQLYNFKCICCMRKEYKDTTVLESRIELELDCDK